MAELIRMAHGSGGRLMHRLIEEIFLPRFGAPLLSEPRLSGSGHGPLADARGSEACAGDDAAELPAAAGRHAFTTDSFVVKPLFFPGGDIGRLAVCGTVNDLAAKGARAEFMAAAFVLEEGLPIETLTRVADSMAAAAREAQVQIVTGDTKGVEHGAADGLFVVTSGVGRIADNVNVSGANARPGDAVMVSGTIAEHGAAVMNARHELRLGGDALQSDCAPLGELVLAALAATPDVHALRDPT